MYSIVFCFSKCDITLTFDSIKIKKLKIKANFKNPNIPPSTLFKKPRANALVNFSIKKLNNLINNKVETNNIANIKIGLTFS
ncbi:uncharacterized protein METZ01_LOCUS203164 [marine metagenome]|uniref:Uncharacterized protein n=1 Tax=marine metagenome TaxID=408172 RepID=A0A382EI09_9ZZZZ